MSAEPVRTPDETADLVQLVEYHPTGGGVAVGGWVRSTRQLYGRTLFVVQLHGGGVVHALDTEIRQLGWGR
jgi:hypothetical protein